jgi:predicted permease
VRAARTGHELTVRSALGASTRHLIGQSLLESLLIATAGASLGVLGAWWIMSLLIAGAPARLPRIDAVSVDGTVLFFSAGLCISSTLLFGLVPALRISKISALGSLYSARRWQTDGPRDNRLRALLLGAEVGFATLLLIGAGLLLTSFQRVLSAPSGFEVENIHTMVIALPQDHYKTIKQKTSFFRQLEKRLEILPGVQHVAYANAVPLSGFQTSTGYVDPIIKTGSDNVPFSQLPLASWLAVSSKYLSTLGVRLHAGRFFEEGESHPVALVSETAARRVWPGQNPIGQQLRFHVDDTKTHWFTVIGVVADVRSTSLEHASLPTVYYPYWQPMAGYDDGPSMLALYIHTPLQNIFETVRKQVSPLGPGIGVHDEGMLANLVSQSVSERRFQAVVVTVFGVVALALACIGVYSVASYSMAQRQKEISIRMALGAGGRDIISFVLRHSMTPVLAGVSGGLVAATSLEQLIANFLFEVRPVDPTTFSGVSLILVAFAALACYVPARRGACTDPAVALRHE